MKKLLLIPALLIASLSLFILAPVANVSAATAKEAVCQGVGLVGDASGCVPAANTTTVDSLIGSIINILSLVVGIICVIMIIIGGLKYITSNGDSNSLTSAKNTILYALIGLVVAGLAQFIVRFVLGRFT